MIHYKMNNKQPYSMYSTAHVTFYIQQNVCNKNANIEFLKNSLLGSQQDKEKFFLIAS